MYKSELIYLLILLGSFAFLLRGRGRSRTALPSAERAFVDGGLALSRDVGEADAACWEGRWAGRPVRVRLQWGRFRRHQLVLECVVEAVLPGVTARLHRPGRNDGSNPTGDAALDERVDCFGPPLELLLRLDPETRAALPRLLEEGWVLDNGDATLELAWSGSPALRVGAWRRSIEALVAAAPPALPTLSARLAAEPDAAVRTRILMAWSEADGPERGPPLPPTVLDDPDPAVAALAAALTGDAAAWDRAPHRAQLSALARAPERVVALHQGRRDVGALLSLLQSTLSHVTEQDRRLLPLVLDALGEVGDRDAIPLVLAFTQKRRLYGADATLLAQRVMAQIQARLEGADRGQVALVAAHPEAGAVGVAEGGGVEVVGRLNGR